MAHVEQVAGPMLRWRLIDGDAVAEVAPGRGGLVTRFAVGGDEVLFLDEGTFADPAKNVRGGVPVLFPFAGKPPTGSALPQHGFARRLAWTQTNATADAAGARVECVLRDGDETRAAWPHPFTLTEVVRLADQRLTMEWHVHNRGDAPMPLHFGLHPYFRVGDKAAVRVDGASGPAFDNVAGKDTAIDRIDFSRGEVDLHFSPFRAGGTTLHRGDGSRLRLTWSEAFDTLVLWTLPGQPFVCVEPWTARGQRPAARSVAPGTTERLVVELTLER